MSAAEDALLTRVRAAASRLAGDEQQTQAVRDAATDVLLETDLMRSVAGLIPIIAAAETAQAAARDAERDTRTLLLACLDQTTGVIRHGSLQASVSRGVPSVVIVDETLISPTLMRAAPDKKAIAAAIKAGGAVPGATLSNAAPVLRITTISGAKS